MRVPPRRGREAETRARLVSKAIVLTVELGGEGAGEDPWSAAEQRRGAGGETEAPHNLGDRVYPDPASCAGSVVPERQ